MRPRQSETVALKQKRIPVRHIAVRHNLVGQSSKKHILVGYILVKNSSTKKAKIES